MTTSERAARRWAAVRAEREGRQALERTWIRIQEIDEALQAHREMNDSLLRLSL